MTSAHFSSVADSEIHHRWYTKPCNCNGRTRAEAINGPGLRAVDMRVVGWFPILLLSFFALNVANAQSTYRYRYQGWTQSTVPQYTGYVYGNWSDAPALACASFLSIGKATIDLSAYFNAPWFLPLDWVDGPSGPWPCASNFMVKVCQFPTVPFPATQACQIWSAPASGAVVYGSSTQATVHDVNKESTRCSPSVGNPILPLFGSKRLELPLGNWRIGGQLLTGSYDSRSKLPVSGNSDGLMPQPPPSFGELWTSNLHKALVFQRNAGGLIYSIQALRGSGFWISFVAGTAAVFAPNTDVSDTLLQTAQGWLYTDAANRAQERYDVAGRLLTVSYASGHTLSYEYSDLNTPSDIAPAPGLIIKIRDEFNRAVQLHYETAATSGAARVYRVLEPSGLVTLLQYDNAGNLTQVHWADGATLKYLYERGDKPWAVTGVIDEALNRLASYGYDEQGRAVETQWAGGANHYSITYTTPPARNVIETYDEVDRVFWREHSWVLPSNVTITNPNGSTSAMEAALVLGIPRMTGQSQPAGAGCAAATTHATYDALGNQSSKDDFNGDRTCYTYDARRNLEATRVEGLGRLTACSALSAANSALPAGSRRISTVWHPDWSLQVKVAESGRITTLIYNGQADPFNGGAGTRCAPAYSGPTDGKPIAVLCKQVEQATTDADGHLGFNAPLQSGVPARVQTWTYNEFGQVLSATDPLGNTSTYTYYADTTFSGVDPWAVGHTRGDLRTATDALGNLTRYELYDKHGNLLQSTDPNGVVTRNTYDLRQRLLSTTVAGQTTAYSYDATGQLLQVTAADGSWVGYEYDPAHRLVAIKDNLGNRIDYTLDNAGNRIDEQSKDAGGLLHQRLRRSIDALGRVQQATGRERMQ